MTNEQLQIRETLDDATRSMSGVCRWPTESQIVLETAILRGQSTMEDVISELPEDSVWTHVAGEPVEWILHPRKMSTPEGQVWDYFVDRPSPVFIPPFYYQFPIDQSGVVRRGWMFHAYGGCL